MSHSEAGGFHGHLFPFRVMTLHPPPPWHPAAPLRRARPRCTRQRGGVHSAAAQPLDSRHREGAPGPVLRSSTSCLNSCEAATGTTPVCPQTPGTHPWKGAAHQDNSPRRGQRGCQPLTCHVFQRLDPQGAMPVALYLRGMIPEVQDTPLPRDK